MKIIIPRKSIKTKIFIVVLLSVFIVTAVFGYLSFEFARNRLISMVGDSIKGIATTTSIFIAQDDVLAILADLEGLKERYLRKRTLRFSNIENDEVSGPAGPRDELIDRAMELYLTYMKVLSNIKAKNQIESPINIYAMDKDRLRLVLTSEPMFPGGPIYTVRPEAKESLTTGIARSTGIYKDKDGIWISAYAPVGYTTTGENKVLIEINYKVSSYMNLLKRELGIIILVCIIGFLGTIFISYRFVTALASAIERLDEAAVGLEKEQYNKPIDVRSDDEIGHLAETFELLRVSIKNKIDELRMSLIREKKAHFESIVALTNAIEMRDPYTKHHLSRVEEYALLIAKKMGLGHNEVEKLRYGCFLHDIGKIYIDELLLQKVELSPEELKEIQKHSERGSKMLEGIQYLKDVKEIVRYHQERYDGKGYPDGLKGEETPLLARIIAVADAFDAMTTDRPYRPRKSFEEAIDEIEKNAGTQFDPNVCSAFLEYRDGIEKIAKKHFSYA